LENVKTKEVENFQSKNSIWATKMIIYGILASEGTLVTLNSAQKVTSSWVTSVESKTMSLEDSIEVVGKTSSAPPF